MPNTTISSSAVNDDLSDIADGLSTCLTTDGQSTMTAALKGFAGTVTAPSYTFSTDLNTGWYRIGADNIGVAVGGQKILDISSTGLDVTGSITQNGMTLLPPGLGPLPWAGATAPSGWLLCYGQSLLRTSYAALFAAIGTAYGAVDGTHFSLPDMRGRVPAGKDDMGGSAAGRLTSTTMTPDGVTLAAVGGAQTHTLTIAELAEHDHAITDTGHVHNEQYSPAAGGSVPGIQRTAGNNTTETAASSADTASATTGITIADAGSDAAHNNVQPTIITNYIIFAGV